jgi:hypothetical protein
MRPIVGENPYGVCPSSLEKAVVFSRPQTRPYATQCLKKRFKGASSRLVKFVRHCKPPVKFCQLRPSSTRKARQAAIIAAMENEERVYRRTDSGRRAWVTKDPAVSDEHRRILGLIQERTRLQTIRPLLRRRADYVRLDDLEADGLIVSEAAACS